MTAAALPVANSYAALSPDNPVRREPVVPKRERTDAFYRGFDRLTVFYDCFWSGDRARVLLVGPPPLNLARHFAAARYVALPSKTPLTPRLHVSRSAAVTELQQAPEETTAIEITIADETFVLDVQPSSVPMLAGRRVLIAVNRDNELGWIREWALWHAVMQGTDTVILFDTAAGKHSPASILATLRTVPGLTHVGVPAWPYLFGSLDPAMGRTPDWARFLPVAAMGVALRRYAEAAAGLLACDVDELAGTRSGTPIYTLAQAARSGLVGFEGTWVEATSPGVRHRDYTQRLRNRRAAEAPRRRWVLDPTRRWVRRLGVLPYGQRIEGSPWFGMTAAKDATYWRFRGISTSLKRDEPRKGATEIDADLAAGFSRLGL